MSMLRKSGPLRGRRRSARRRRRASFIAELLVTMPVFMIFLWAVVQFGLFYSNMQVVNLASRVGAERASELVTLPASGEVPVDVRNAINEHLASSSITYCRVRLEHNGPPGYTQVALVSPGTVACDCEPNSVLAIPPTPGPYVRVTVCVQATQLMPNLLQVVGLDMSSKVVSSTTVLRHEL